jgi:hypothetical protein
MRYIEEGTSDAPLHAIMIETPRAYVVELK